MSRLITQDDLRHAWNADQEKHRRESVRELLDIYRHEWRYLLIERINDRFIEQNAERLRAQADTSVNLLRWVTDELAAIYTEPCFRSVDGSSEGLAAYENNGLIDLFLDQANKLTQLCREIAIRPLWDEDAGALCYDLVTPDKFSVVPHPTDPLRFLAIIIELPKNYHRACYSVWTDGSHFLADEQMRPLDSEENPDHLNPYGVIPYVVTHARFPAQSFFNQRDSFGLRDATLDAGVQKTDHNHLRHIQSFKQLAITGSTDEQLGRLSLDPSLCALIKNPQASVQVLDLQANLREHLETLYLGVRPTLAMAGIWQDVVKGSSDSASGYALSLKMHKQTTIWARMRGLWSLYEKQLYSVASIVSFVDAGVVLPMGNYEVEFPDIGPASNPLDKATIAEKYQAVGMSRQNIWREVFGKSEEWIAQNEAELTAQEWADAPIEIPAMPEEPEIEVELSEDILDDEELLA